VLLREGTFEELSAVLDILRLKRREIVWTAPHLEARIASLFRKRLRPPTRSSARAAAAAGGFLGKRARHMPTRTRLRLRVDVRRDSPAYA
jgi:hypothetical protein